MTPGSRLRVFQPTEPHPQLGVRPGYRWVYVWHWPIRAMHWWSAGCIVLLAATGLYIGKPYFMTAGEPSAHFLMGWARMIHFAAAGLIVATGIVRIYWLFVGNRYERWKALFPIHRKDWVNMYKILRKYAFVRPLQAPHYLGHNPLQQLLLTLVYLIVVVQIVTGFTMYGLANPGGFFATIFGWVAPLMGGLQMVRFIHHVNTWFFFIFLPFHVYMSLRADLVHREARVSSIISGGRFVREDVPFEDA